MPASSLDGDNAGEATNVPDSGDVEEVQEGDAPIATFGTIEGEGTDGEWDGGFGLTPGLNEARQDGFDYGV